MEPTSTTNPSTVSAVGLRYGILTSLVWIVVDVILRMTNLSFKFSLYFLAIVVVWSIGLVLAQRFYKQQNGGFMSFKEGLIISLILGIVLGLISGVFGYLYVNFLDTDYLQRQRDDMEAWMSTLPNVTEEQIEKSLAGMNDDKGKSLLTIGAGLLNGAVGGFLLGLIISAFTKHTRPEFE
jgi:hypothetical protein